VEAARRKPRSDLVLFPFSLRLLNLPYLPSPLDPPSLVPVPSSFRLSLNLTDDGAADADCWWTCTFSALFPSFRRTRTDPFSNSTGKQCTTPKLEGLADDVAYVSPLFSAVREGYGKCPFSEGAKTDSLPVLRNSTCPEPNTWGFTLDDGPNCSHNAYYDYLEEQNQKATLFCALAYLPLLLLLSPRLTFLCSADIGSNVLDWPLEAQRGLADGHEMFVPSLLFPCSRNAVLTPSSPNSCSHTWSHRCS
jgi:hypothetical protein